MNNTQGSLTRRIALLSGDDQITNEDSLGLYHRFNDAGLECEVGELMYSFIRVLKPANVLETGTHFGIGASYIGMALKDNARGQLDTIEFLPEIHKKAVERMQKLELTDIVKCHLMDVKDFQPEYMYDFVLLDTEPQTRFAELLKFFDFVTHGGYIFIHDLHRHMHQIPNEEHGFAWPYGQLPYQIRQLVAHNELRPFHFPNPRGLTGFYKTSKDDYVWR